MVENPIVFQRVTALGALEQARVTKEDVVRVIRELEEVPGGVAESPVAADAAGLLRTAIENADDEVESNVIPDGQSDAIHFALERMQELSAGLHTLRDVVAPH